MSELSRKRPHTDEGTISVAKKRVLAGSNGTPQVNGHSDQTEDEMLLQANLEKFRKEAIYRRMKHYLRENERNTARIEELERRKTTCEAGLAAISACWAQLNQSIRTFVKSDDLPSSSDTSKADPFDLCHYVEKDTLPELHDALENTASVTRALVTTLIESGGARNILASESGYVHKLQKSQSECAGLRSQLELLTQQLEDCQSQRDQYHSELLSAESRAERLQSESWNSVHPQKPHPLATSTSGEGGSATPAAATTEDAESKPSSPSQPPPSGSTHSPATQYIIPSEAVSIWEKTISNLEQENAILKHDIAHRGDRLHKWAEAPQQNKYDLERMKGHFGLLEATLAKAKEEIEALTTSRKEWEAQIKAASESAINEYKTAIAQRDVENQRLREQLDQGTAELLERRQADNNKWDALHEFKKLAEARQQRILLYKTELSRWKARLAANEGQGDLMHFFLQGNPDEAALIETLREQKAKAELRAHAAENALSRLAGDDSHGASSSSAPPTPVMALGRASALVKSLADAEEKVLQLTKELEGLQKVFGERSLVVPPDVGKLNEQIRSQAKEVERLSLLQQQHEKEQAPLFAEIDKLSANWEVLDKQVSDKVFDLHHLEDKLAKSLTEKAKSDNKFYAAMREKEAWDAERTAMARVEEKRAAILKNMHEAVAEKENLLTSLRADMVNQNKALDFTRSQAAFWEGQHMVLNTQKIERQMLCDKHVRTYDKEVESLRKLQKELREQQAKWIVEQKALEEKIEHLKAHGSKDKSGESMRKLLLCSTCETTFRTAVITKCMHTFCKKCVDDRIKSRQRKCPACNVSFSQSEVAPLYFQ